MNVCEKIRFLRQLKGWSQEEMANKLAISLNGYGSIERGETDVTLNRLEQITQVFGVDLMELLGLNEKSILNLACGHDNNHWHLGSSSSDNLQLQHELDKQTLVIQQQEKEIAYLKEIIALMKNETP